MTVRYWSLRYVPVDTASPPTAECARIVCAFHLRAVRQQVARQNNKKHTRGTVGAQNIFAPKFLYTSRPGGPHCARRPSGLWRFEGGQPRWTRYQGTADGWEHRRWPRESSSRTMPSKIRWSWLERCLRETACGALIVHESLTMSVKGIC